MFSVVFVATGLPSDFGAAGSGETVVTGLPSGFGAAGSGETVVLFDLFKSQSFRLSTTGLEVLTVALVRFESVAAASVVAGRASFL